MPSHKQKYNTPWVVDQYSKFTGLRKAESYLVEKYFKQSHLIYDIGCGTGRTTRELYKLGFKVTGMDFSEAMIKNCKSHNPDISWQINDACNTPYKNNSFDICFFSYNGIDTIVPRSSRFKSIQEMARITKPGGYVIYSSRNILCRVFKRFAVKTFFKAIRVNLSELRVQLLHNLPLFREGYILQDTNLEGKLNVYTITMQKNIHQFKKLAPDFNLVERIGLNPGNKKRSYLNFNCHMIYYVWQKPL